jgi:hypothetical protein
LQCLEHLFQFIRSRQRTGGHDIPLAQAALGVNHHHRAIAVQAKRMGNAVGRIEIT